MCQLSDPNTFQPGYSRYRYEHCYYVNDLNPNNGLNSK